MALRRVIVSAVFAALLSAAALAAEEGGAVDKAPRPAAPASAARLDKWVVIGPGGGGSQYDPVISPHDKKTVIVHCDMTGGYISKDGGDSWRMFNLRGGVDFAVFDPGDPNVIYVKETGLWRSTDGGKTWDFIHPDPAKIESIGMPDDHAGEAIAMADGSKEEIESLAVDPADSKTLYATMTKNDAPGFFCVSTDWGKTWKTETQLPGRVERLIVEAKSPKEARTVYALRAEGTSVREHGEWTANGPPEGVTTFSNLSAGFPKDGGKLIIYGAVTPSWRRQGPGGAGAAGGTASKPGLYVSTDGGATWADVTTILVGGPLPEMPAPNPEARRPAAGSTEGAAGGPPAGGRQGGFRMPRIGPIAACMIQGESACAQVSNIPQGEGKDAFSGIAKTTDAGKTWQLIKDETPREERSFEGLPWMYELYTQGQGPGFTTMGMSPTDPDVVFGTDLGRTARSTDGGRTWEACFTKFMPDGTVTTRGLDVTTCYGVHFDPFDPKRVFISYTDIGAFKSEDGGATWAIGTTDVPRQWRNTTYWMVFDPEVKGRVWGVFCGPHDLPRPKMWRRRGDLKFGGGVCISEDAGNTWQVSSEGMPASGGCTHIIMDPKSPVDARVLYVAGMGNGVFKSTDGGKTWILKKEGIEGEQPLAWRLAMDKEGTLWCVVARRSEDGSIGNDGDGALYRSTDAAEHWEKIALPEGTNGPNGLAVDAADSKRLYLAAWGRDAGTKAEGGGIFLSTDAGKTWKKVLSKDQHVYDVTVDPRNSKTLYACGFENSAWRSDDRGETWRRLAGFNFKWGHRVIPDPYDPDKIFVTTFGGSVWYGPATGDPDATDDIATASMVPGQ